MKKVTLTVLVAGMIFASCSDNGKKVEANEAETVETVQNEATVEFKTVAEGSHLAWRASHLGGVQPRFGVINLKSADFSVTNNKLTNGTVLIDMTSLTVDNFGDDEESKGKLTGHLLTADFFDTETYPTSKFELTSTEASEGDYNMVVTGNLTILEVTKSISFNANVTISENEVILKSEDFAVDRSDWGLTYHAEGDEGVPVDYLIADDIGFTIDVTLTK